MIQAGGAPALSDFAETLSPEQMGRLSEIVNREMPMSEEVLDDYIRALRDAPLQNISQRAGELSGDALLNVVERLRQKKKEPGTADDR